MPSLVESLIDYESDLLEMIVEQWGIGQDLPAGRTSPKRIAALIQEQSLFQEFVQALPREDFNALLALARNQGRLPIDRFERQFGNLREMGAARRSKTRPDRSPLSISENLFYKGLIARAFLKDGSEAREFYFIPDEFLIYLLPMLESEAVVSVHWLSNTVPKNIQPAGDFLLDHICTLLAGLRAGMLEAALKMEFPGLIYPFLIQLAAAAELLNEHHQVHPEKVGALLEMPRQAAFLHLVQNWRSSSQIDETLLLKDIQFEGSGHPDALAVRSHLLSLLQQLPHDNWLEIEQFIQWTKSYHPDILRTGGEYDSWIVKHTLSGSYLKGFESWDQVEGAYLRMQVGGPCFWMGLLDLGSQLKSAQPTHIRLSSWASDLLKGKPLQFSAVEATHFVVKQDGSLILERNFPLSIRYQIARLCEWKKTAKDKYSYQLSASALKRAAQQGLHPGQLLSLVKKYGQPPLPPSLLQALKRWEQHGREVQISPVLLLQTNTAVIMDQVLASRASKYIEKRLNETSAIIKPRLAADLSQALLAMGILPDTNLEV